METIADLDDPDKAKRYGIALQERVYRGGDVVMNPAANTLATHAFLLTHESKYVDWVKEYVGAWLDRTRANGGISPDNVGLCGEVGEHCNGKWRGGLYGWRWPHGYHSVGKRSKSGPLTLCCSPGIWVIWKSLRLPEVGKGKPVVQTAEVSAKFFQLALAPAAGITLEMGIRRYCNRPNYAFSWHGDAIPFRFQVHRGVGPRPSSPGESSAFARRPQVGSLYHSGLLRGPTLLTSTG